MKRIISNNFKNITRHYSSLSSLKKISLADSFPIIWDIQKSFGSTLIDSDNGQQYLDFHGGFGSNPIGWNHPKLVERMKNVDTSLLVNKPANGDLYTNSFIDYIEKMSFSKYSITSSLFPMISINPNSFDSSPK